MLLRPRVRTQESGFTFIELLIVIVIMGSLAAIALPAFINQRGKASDVTAKHNLALAYRAMESYFLDHRSYAAANMNPVPDADSLVTIEPTLEHPPKPTITSQDSNSYALQAVSTSEPPVTFRLERRSDDRIVRRCTPASTGGCNAGGTW